ncbi:hypothetical protein J1N35_038279 [Gossypium stocksii]|uniref:Reverse transcriptase n=1 Tax=Gossypium stocksii TaxID=47602 RepID=A0A9D3ZMR0_9ROSI|nr:hypothetical protein J1N35_038279 [Gossypium stocksii]
MTFFHKSATQRRWQNMISGLENDSGVLATEVNEMVTLATEYFKKLFSSKQFNDGVYNEEITRAVKSMAPLKASGPDGFPVIFYQKYWHVIGKDVSGLCLNMLNGRRDIGEINRTNIVLIPKEKLARSMNKFRPISLCNVIYKIISKVLANRFRLVFEECIEDTRGAFMPGSILFGEASIVGANNMKRAIQEYEKVLGHGNVDLDTNNQVGQLLGVRISNNPEKYLGLPTIVGRQKRHAFVAIKERCMKLLNSWNMRLLSSGGKEVFLKSVLQAIPVYAMQCFKLPSSLCHDLEALFSKFWWRNTNTGKGIHWCR